jgi:V-type H+-transporting ATPase subunit C
MPSDQSTWLIAIPNDGDAEGLLPEITSKLVQASRSSQAAVTEFAIPAFKVGSPYVVHRAVLMQRRNRRRAP